VGEYGVVLSSDGSKSSFEIGAWKALRELNIRISCVSGSFVGALNAALISQGDFEKAVRFWRYVSAKSLFSLSKAIAEKYTNDWSRLEAKAFRKQFVAYIQERNSSVAPLKELIDSFIDEKEIRKSSVAFSFVAVSVLTHDAEMINLKKIPKGRLNHFLLAAACYPQISMVNRSLEPDFSADISPYKLLEADGAEEILSTDEILAIPPNLRSNVQTIRASEAMEFSLNESVEKMRSNIQLGYMDTLRIFEESLGEYYFIKDGANVEFANFKEDLGKDLPAHLNYLVLALLGLDEMGKAAVEEKLEELMKRGGARYEDLHVGLIENLAKFLAVKNDEKYVLDKLLLAAVTESRRLLASAKESLSSSTQLRDTLENVEEPGKGTPGPTLFMAYFLLLISAKPEKYDRFESFIEYLHPKTIAALATLLYLSYA